MDQSLLPVPPIEIEWDGSAVIVRAGTSRGVRVTSSECVSRNGASLPIPRRAPGSLIPPRPGIRSAQSNRNGRRSNRNSGTGCVSELRRASAAQDVNNELTDTKKTGQRSRMAVLTRVAWAESNYDAVYEV